VLHVRVWRGLDDVSRQGGVEGGVVTFGKFDGGHRGHQRVVVEPQVQPDMAGKDVKGKDGIYTSPVDEARAHDRKFPGGNPVAKRELAKLEAKAIKTGHSPRQIKKAKGTQTAKLLTLLVEFNDQGNDDFTDVMVPKTVFEDRECVPGAVPNGPRHNNIPNPASLPHADNNSMWVPDFSPEHFDKMLYSREGITERVRTDLTGPDGKPGVDISGRTTQTCTWRCPRVRTWHLGRRAAAVDERPPGQLAVLRG
jgi:hypothetical protein